MQCNSNESTAAVKRAKRRYNIIAVLQRFNYSLTAKEWKVHSEWKMFHSKGVNFTLTRVKFHSYKNNISLISLFQEWKSLFIEWIFHSFLRVITQTTLEWLLLCLLKFKLVHSRKGDLSDHSLKRVKNPLNKERFSLLKEWNLFSLFKEWN